MSNMVDYEKHFRVYCEENSLTINLSFDMPEGYETANGTFDPTVNTLFINKEMLQSQPEYEQMFYLFHELRHALQYLHPERFDELISRSRLYVIQYDGTCYKLVDGEWKECKLDGSTEHFTELYLGQPYEWDANDFAYERVKALLGDSPELQELHTFWTPKKPIADQAYEEVYGRIDEMIGEANESNGKGINKMICQIEQIPSISAIYYALLQSGYEFFSLERDQCFSNIIKGYVGTDAVPSFFSKVTQNTCDVYPYWPRAYILETASFYLDKDLNGFSDFNSFQRRILFTANISAEEKDNLLWTWVTGFPGALKEVVNSAGFSRYLKWEKEWISEQNNRYRDELRLLDVLLSDCRKNYHLSCQNIRIALCPIKCVYSSDHHIFDGSFIFTSGDMRSDSIIHEFLHTIIHPLIEQGITMSARKQYPDIDESYYLDKSEQGYRNAFEEYAVRMVTKKVMEQEKLPDLHAYLEKLAAT